MYHPGRRLPTSPPWVGKGTEEGDAVGESNIDEFFEQVNKWVVIGSARPGHKISVARMVHLLEAKYSMRCDFPTEKQVNALVAKFFEDERKARIQALKARVERGVRRGTNCSTSI